MVSKRLGYKVLGLSLEAFGVLLSVPGVPGQGLLTILVGLLIAGGSTQRRIARRMLSRPSLLKTLNGLRARYGKEPSTSRPSSMKEIEHHTRALIGLGQHARTRTEKNLCTRQTLCCSASLRSMSSMFAARRLPLIALVPVTAAEALE